MKGIRKHVLIEGHVQGVFFRSTMEDKARSRGVAGWVTNRADGKVEAVLEGDETAVQELVSWCHNGPPSAEVSDVNVTTESPEGLDGFHVR